MNCAFCHPGSHQYIYSFFLSTHFERMKLDDDEDDDEEEDEEDEEDNGDEDDDVNIDDTVDMDKIEEL